MTAEEHVPDLLVERLALGELPPERAADVRRRLEAAGQLDRLEGLAADDRAILERYPAEAMARAIDRRLTAALEMEPGPPSPEPWWRRPWALALPAAVAAALVLVVVSPWSSGPQPFPRPEQLTVPAVDDGVRTKGLDPYLVAYRKRGDAVEKLEEGADVRAGDTIQLSYVAAGARHGVIVSIDGRGAVTSHLPVRDASAAELSEQGEHALPSAYELDDAPHFERFVLVTSQRPFPTSIVERAARQVASDRRHAATAPLDLPDDLHQTSLVLEKVSP